MDANSYFLHLHAHVHGHGSGAAHRVFFESSEEQLRTILPGHNSLAWIIWLIARGEDWGVNAMLCGREELLTRDGWTDRLGVSRLDFGAGMTADEVAGLTTQIDIEALRAYFEAVYQETRSFVETVDFDRLDDPLDVEGRLQAFPHAFTAGAHILYGAVKQLTTGRWFLDSMALADVMLHVEEGQHVFRQLAPELRWG